MLSVMAIHYLLWGHLAELKRRVSKSDQCTARIGVGFLTIMQVTG